MLQKIGGTPILPGPKKIGHPKITTGQVSMFREDSARMCIPVSMCVYTVITNGLVLYIALVQFS